MNVLSLYCHIPFCVKKCRYCDFYSVPYDTQLAETYLSTLAKEIELCKIKYDLDGSAKIKTVFIGGGTPTALTAGQLRTLCRHIRAGFPFAPGCEWTVECNPESFTKDKATTLFDEGVTRLTFGFQSLDDRELSFLGRIHSADRCREILANPACAQFASIGVDLIYGLPGQTSGTLEHSLEQIAGSPQVKHISAYELTVADGTPLGRRRSRLPLPGDDTMSVMTGRLWDTLEAHGFAQYEVSNFARKGHECRHNMTYWNHEPYLGLGCAAHSFLPPERSANIRDVNRYCAMVNDGQLPREFTEKLNAEKLGMEMLFLGLRTVRGINEDVFAEKCGKSLMDFVDKEKIDALVNSGLLYYEKPFWKPTKKGLLMADGIAREII
jgi:oxygen-independent coproporphyrinogen III oxidase